MMRKAPAAKLPSSPDQAAPTARPTPASSAAKLVVSHAEIAQDGDDEDDVEDDREDVGDIALQGRIEIARRQHARIMLIAMPISQRPTM